CSDEPVRFERSRYHSGLVRKLVLIVIDSLTVEMLDRAVESGKAPMLAELVRRGTHFRDAVSVFPSVTPVASATIVTGVELDRQGWMRRVAQAANLRHAVYGPSELFYGELYTSRPVDCRPALARPGTRDAYSGCVGAYLAEYGLYDFLLFSLPDNDHYSHRRGPDATVASIAWADHNLERLAMGCGGVESFFEGHAVILMADHSQTVVEQRI